MTAICPDCGEDSLMMGNIGSFFGVDPWCANRACKTNMMGDLE